MEKAMSAESLQIPHGEAAIKIAQTSAHDLKHRITLGNPLDINALTHIERILNLHHAKWDTHIGDGSVLSAEPLLICEDEWRWLSIQAEAAARELFALEHEIAFAEDIQKLIGLPRNLRKLLKHENFTDHLRTLRFDFHPTTSGWVISEVNSDVPGGFGEASFLPSLYKTYTDARLLPIMPIKVWGDTIQSRFSTGTVALLHAPGFLEDEQVVRVLAEELRDRGFHSHLIQSPFALKWDRGFAYLRRDTRVKIEALLRFYQVEWLSELPSWTGWKNLCRARYHQVCVINPIISAISESKRLGLCFQHLVTQSDTIQS